MGNKEVKEVKDKILYPPYGSWNDFKKENVYLMKTRVERWDLIRFTQSEQWAMKEDELTEMDHYKARRVINFLY